MAQSHKHYKGRRRKRWYRQKDSVGLPPGTLSVPPGAQPTAITLFAYNVDRCIEQPIERVEEIREFLGKYPVVWINVDGLGDLNVIQELGKLFHLHPLALEDVVHTHQRPKVDQFDNSLFIVMRMVQRREQLESEQVSIFVGRNYVLTFQENLPGDSFGPVRERLRVGGPLTSLGPDYLAYRLLDAIVDGYFPALEQYGELLESLEDEVLELPRRDTLVRVHEIRHDLLTLRRAVWPMREAINSLVRDPNALIHADTRLFLRDCYDHTVQLMDFLETYRELGADLRDLHLSAASNRLSEIMKVLTIMSSIFIPLTFIAGLYGMNFQYRTEDGQVNPLNMPELRWYWGYPMTLAVMLFIAVMMVVYFYRKGWIGQPRPPTKKGGDLRAQEPRSG